MDTQPVIVHLIILIFLFLLTLIAVLPSKWLYFRYLKAPSLPLMSIPLYLVYEFTMPSNIDIRIDVLILWPILFICIALSAIRLFRQKKNSPE